MMIRRLGYVILEAGVRCIKADWMGDLGVMG